MKSFWIGWEICRINEFVELKNLLKIEDSV